MEKIEKIINNWDPIDLFPMAPKDEYIGEITKIYEYVYSNKNLQIQTLAEKINTIFIKAFGIDVYNENIEECMLIAKKILE